MTWLQSVPLPIVLLIAGIYTIVSALKGNFKHAMEALVVVLIGLLFVGLGNDPGQTKTIGGTLLSWL